MQERKELARLAFNISSHYDTAIFNWFTAGTDYKAFKHSLHVHEPLRYGENPHQSAVFFGDLKELFDNLNGKAISYNNLVDIDAAVRLMSEFKNMAPTFAILKHTNACGVATRPTILEAWKTALSSDPISAFGGVLICNQTIDLATAQEINKLFYEVLIAPDFEAEALKLLMTKKTRILLKIKAFQTNKTQFKSLLNGVIQQDSDGKTEVAADLKPVTLKTPTPSEIEDLLYANICVKHLKSNGIAIVKNRQLLTMGCGQTSRVDALRQALEKRHYLVSMWRARRWLRKRFSHFPIVCKSRIKQVSKR
jgi:phosphoribosylaminoimidazolecarboxamide formyltransferase/IMP cyclohydrolase